MRLSVLLLVACLPSPTFGAGPPVPAPDAALATAPPLAPTRILRLHRLHQAGFSAETIAGELNEDRPPQEPDWTAERVREVLAEPVPEAVRQLHGTAPVPASVPPMLGPNLGVELLGDHGAGGGVFAGIWSELFGAEMHLHLRQSRLEDDHDKNNVADTYAIAGGLRLLVGPTLGRVRPSLAVGVDVEHAEVKTTGAHATGAFLTLGGRLDVLVADHVVAGVSLLEYRYQLLGELRAGTAAAPSLTGGGFEAGLFSAHVAYLFR